MNPVSTLVPINPINGDVATVFREMAALIFANRKPDEDASTKQSLTLLGLGSPSGSIDHLSLEAGRSQALRSMSAGGFRNVGGWNRTKSNLGNFGRDYLFRAQVAIRGLAALPSSEAIYMRAMTSDGKPQFMGGPAYRLRFQAGQEPPVDAFWSLTLYEPDSTGAFFFYDNTSRLYAIKSGPELKRKADQSVEIIIAHTKPEDPNVNWLPAPTSAFALTFRAYRPAPELLNCLYHLPSIEELG